MERLKVVQIAGDELLFSDGSRLFSHHDFDCCENHYLDFEHIEMSDFDGLEFDLSGESFFNRIEGYGIELIPIYGHSVKVPGYGENNGYYNSDISLVLIRPDGKESWHDVTACQDYYSE